MTRSVYTLLLLCLLATLGAGARPASGRIRVMPLGDSITQGGLHYASYRYPLWFDLSAAGHDVDFVGRRDYLAGFSAPNLAWYPYYYNGFDRDHEGYWGWRTDEVAAVVPGAALAGQPDVVLIHLGTNDVGQLGAAGVANADASLRAIIGALRAVRPAVAVLLARIIPIGPTADYAANAAWVDSLNLAIAGIVADSARVQSPVLLVDQHGGFDPATMLQPDGVHPNRAGEDRMAEVWLAALATLLPPVSPPPGESDLTVANPSFEDPLLADGDLAEGPGLLAGWIFSGTPGTVVGIINPPAESYPTASGDGTPAGADSANVAYLLNDGGSADSVSVVQILSETLSAATEYTLTVAVGKPAADPPPVGSDYGGYRIELLAGGTVIARDEDGVEPPAGEFRDAVAAVTSDTLDTGLLGRPLAVRLTISAAGSNRATHFDGVRLSRRSTLVTGVPAAPPRPVRLVASPNPFSDRTRIAFPEASHAGEPVAVSVFDVSGRRIRRIGISPGADAAWWDGRTDRGRPAPPGVYFLRAVIEGRPARARLVKTR